MYKISKCNSINILLMISLRSSVACKISFCIIQDIVHDMSRSNISLRMSKQIYAIYSESLRMKEQVIRSWKILKQYLSNCGIYDARYLIDDHLLSSL